MTHRRAFLTGLVATGLVPALTWADAGAPAFLSAARRADGRHALCGLSQTGQILFDIDLPDRGHAAAAHPDRPEAIAFARRPGTYALVIDCVRGTETARLTAPAGRHFYGHGVFSGDGSRLYTAENDFNAARGVIGIWDARGSYARLGEMASGGLGPHDLKLMPDGAALVIANGGIETHPESGRTKLNLPVMRPNLSYVSLGGTLLEQVELDPALHRNSIRHLAVGRSGDVVFAMQWQGDAADRPPVLGRHRRGHAAQILRADDAARARMVGYAGSVALSRNGRRVAVTSPRGGLCQVFDETGPHDIALVDVCGVAGLGDGFVLTTGGGLICSYGSTGELWRRRHDHQWDNHLVPLSRT